MIEVKLSNINWSYDKNTKTVLISETEVPFGTSYKLISTKTGDSKVFNLSHSTGPEFHPKTCWIYTSDDGLTLSVANDSEMVKRAADNYLKAKLGK